RLPQWDCRHPLRRHTKTRGRMVVESSMVPADLLPWVDHVRSNRDRHHETVLMNQMVLGVAVQRWQLSWCRTRWNQSLESHSWNKQLQQNSPQRINNNGMHHFSSVAFLAMLAKDACSEVRIFWVLFCQRIRIEAHRLIVIMQS